MPDVPGVTDAAAGGPPGGGVLPPVTSSELRVASGKQGDMVAEAFNRREREGKKPRTPRKKDDGLPDGNYTLEDFRRMFSDDEDDDDGDALQGDVVVVDEHADADGARLASRVLSKMGRPGR